ncbi:MAG: aminotransferase class I/II-fold pyridoxal phosphate-dependent enzyme [Bifidobacteriaceae bacterium]|jgi:aspartate/methionine/tyrosine aminotransferase|nr:aminotransferase class I/II-fold pyridoxal phosphate-dependent enzyme [Bifidobacteriaceae bacterium]
MGFDLAALPTFPWDLLAPHKRQAQAHPGGLIDLSVGSPVDPTPPVLREALAGAADAPGYPPTIGANALRQAIAAHYADQRGVPGIPPEAIIPTIGSKEAVALLPSLLGLGPGAVVVHPRIAYPTYDVGARLAGASPLPADLPDEVPPEAADRVKLVWLNSPANPTGRVASVEELRSWVDWARPRGVVIAADECYAALAWTEPWSSQGVPSLLDPRVVGGSAKAPTGRSAATGARAEPGVASTVAGSVDLTGLLALGSLSKRSSAAGYRAAWLVGDPALLARIAELRKHIGLMTPAPVQAALTAALADQAHVAEARRVYGRRRARLLGAVTQAGYEVAESGAGLYLWFTTPDRQDGWLTVADLASIGILVAPGAFYGEAGRPFARMALTATDAQVAEAAGRLSAA